MFTDDKVKILRGLASWILSAIGIWGMVVVHSTIMLGPRLLNVSMFVATIFMLFFLLFRAGFSLR
jgi:hypothetical protein